MHGSAPKAVAFYLPQFHPIPENDRWWGPGFTEWTNVARANPLFRGHYQPHIPGDLGFYDLRLQDTRVAQADLAARHGISAFCYYHYWFEGQRILERPFSEVLESGTPDFPFCLCWANEDWTRTWDGTSREVLLKQTYSRADDRAHFEALLPAFLDRRYLTHEGKPVFLIYRSLNLPEVAATLDQWQEWACENGLPGIHFVRVESFPEENGDPRGMGFAAAVEFQPEWRTLAESRRRKLARTVYRLAGRPLPKRWRHSVFRYDYVVQRALEAPLPGYPRYSCVAPSWDNSARRREDGLIVTGSTPELYGHWLTQTVARAREPYVFINAWNEWAEGCHLEPCRKWGHGYLLATRNALAAQQAAPDRVKSPTADEFSQQPSRA